jgi:arginyl-tRNA synthetase
VTFKRQIYKHMNIIELLQLKTAEELENRFQIIIEQDDIIIKETRKEFSGDFTIVVFPFAKTLKMKPQEIGDSLGQAMCDNVSFVESFETVQGFVNLKLKNSFWSDMLNEYNKSEKIISKKTHRPRKIMVEYSSPNTNKPLHLGHIRNNLLGYSISKILKARGHEVVRACLYNDRGANICKSMLAWMKYANAETPENSGKKGDFLVGEYYVRFETEYRKQVSELVEKGMTEEEAKKNAPILAENRELLKKWETGDASVNRIWKMMNEWVYKGFEATYQSLGVAFDQNYYESETYLIGKEMVKEGLESGIFYNKDNGSVWIDLTDEGLDEKLLLREDGTAVYITQDMGTADRKYDDYKMHRSIYVVGNEQDYHFNVLKLILKKMERPYAEGIYHLSYGMVDLPSGKMKSREGTVVDADDLIADMLETAANATESLGKTAEMSDEEKHELHRKIALGALKFYILKTDPKKRMLFNPEESIDLQGFTGPFIQYTYARIRSLIRKSGINEVEISKINAPVYEEMHDDERGLIRQIYLYEALVEESEENLSPSLIANFVYHLAKSYNRFYHEHQVLTEQNEGIKQFRILLSRNTARVIKHAMGLLGIEMPERM